MNRRDFGKLMALSAVSTAVAPKISASDLNGSSTGPQAKVFLEGLRKGSADYDIARAVKAAANAATDFSWLSKGDRVFIKPACNSGNEYPATSHPAGIRAMVELLREKGAGKVIVSDMSGIAYVKLSPDGLRGSTRKLMQENGMFQAAEAGGAELYFPEEHGWNDFFEDGPAGSHWKAGIWIPSILNRVDHIILMPRSSRHMLLGNTLGMKAVVGYMRFDSRTEYHRDAASIYAKTAEANTIPTLKNKLRLVLTVATKTITTMGPDQGHISEPETGLIFASDSIVAHDMVSQAWVSINREQVPQSQKITIRDPYFTFHNPFNRATVMLLAGAAEAARTQDYEAVDAKSIREEPILKRAFQVFQGMPQLTLADRNETIPHELLGKIRKAVDSI